MDEIKNKDDYNPDIVTLSDDDGKEYTFEVLDAIETDMGRYLAMLPVYDDPKEQLNDSGELVIVKVGEEDGDDGCGLGDKGGFTGHYGSFRISLAIL